MGCLINAGVLKECGHNFGGIKELYLGNSEDIATMTYAADGSISGATMVTAAVAYKFEFVKDTGQILEELVKNGASSFINQTLNFQLDKITLAKRDVLENLGLSTMYVIVKKADNSFWFYGEPSKSAGLEATVLTIDSGVAQGDSAGATITLVGGSLGYAVTMADSVLATFLGA